MLLQDKFKLHTIDDVALIFDRPEKVSVGKHVKQVADMVKEYGCYRAFGDVMLLTDADIENLLRNMAARGAAASEPLDTDLVALAFIGSKSDISSDVFVAWCPPGDEALLTNKVRDIVPDVWFLDSVLMTYADYKEWVDGVQRFRSLGRWYSRTRAFNAEMTAILRTENNDNG